MKIKHHGKLMIKTRKQRTRPVLCTQLNSPGKPDRSEDLKAYFVLCDGKEVDMKRKR